jgi:hypothetical protein
VSQTSRDRDLGLPLMDDRDSSLWAGIDRMAAAEARHRGLQVIEHLPAGTTWPHYSERNERIARGCDELVRIADPHSRTFGSGWTRDRARGSADRPRSTRSPAGRRRPARPRPPRCEGSQMHDRDRDRQCAVSRCRAPSLPDTTPLDIDGECVEVDLCPYHASGLIRAMADLCDAADEADFEDEADDDESDDELERLRLIETAAEALVALAKTEPAWMACDEFRALRMVLEGSDHPLDDAQPRSQPAHAGEGGAR